MCFLRFSKSCVVWKSRIKHRGFHIYCRIFWYRHLMVISPQLYIFSLASFTSAPEIGILCFSAVTTGLVLSSWRTFGFELQCNRFPCLSFKIVIVLKIQRIQIAYMSELLKHVNAVTCRYMEHIQVSKILIVFSSCFYYIWCMSRDKLFLHLVMWFFGADNSK